MMQTIITVISGKHMQVYPENSEPKVNLPFWSWPKKAVKTKIYNLVIVVRRSQLLIWPNPKFWPLNVN